MKKYLNILLISLFIWSLNFKAFAQTFNPDEYKVFYNFKTIKNPDQTRTFQVSYLTQNLENKQDEMPVYGAEIQFVNVLDDQETVLGTVKTDKSGIAKLVLSQDQSYLKDPDSYIRILARFAGSDLVESQEEEVLFKDLVLELMAEEIDSVKTVTINASYINNDGELVPVEEADVSIRVKGMIQNLTINDGTLEGGTYEYTFEDVIPGDKDGNLEIYAVIEENDDFANVIQMKKATFGTKFVPNVTKDNQLWSSAAPYWMYIVLTLLLVGVWINFTYTIVNLFKIKKEARKES